MGELVEGEIGLTTQVSGDGRGCAVFSECERYRYYLSRRLNAGLFEPGDASLRWLHACLLNPSTADAFQNDPTVAGLIHRAFAWGYDGLIVTNAFAWRSTDPSVLPAIADPVGPENDRHILSAAKSAAMTICGWGGHAKLHDRGVRVAQMLIENGIALHALRVSVGTGQPWHPLYIGYAQMPEPWIPEIRRKSA